MPGFQRSGFTETTALGWEPHFPGLDLTLVPGLYKWTFSQTDTLFSQLPNLRQSAAGLQSLRLFPLKSAGDIWVKNFHTALSRHDLKTENLHEKEKKKEAEQIYCK